MAEAVRVEGLRELERTFGKMGREVRTGLRNELATAAEPVRQDAERLATARIRRIGPMRPRSWANMRVGQTRGVVYVAPKQRGRQSRINPRLHRPNLKRLLLDRALEPALAENEQKIIARLDFLLELIAERNGF